MITCLLLLQKDGANTVSHTEVLLDDVRVKDVKALTPLLETEEIGAFHPVYRGASNAFCIRLFFIDEEHETR